MDRESMIQNAQEEGLEKGRTEGKVEGFSLFGKLADILLAEGNTKDLQSAISNPTFRDSLLKKYHLI